MAVPTTIADLSTTAALNSPAGSDNLSTADDYLRAIQGIVKTVYTDSSARSETLTNKTVALGSNTVSGTFAQFNTAVTDAELARTDAANTFTGTQTFGDLTTTGNTILGNASTDTLNVGNGDLVKDASGNVGVGVTPSAWGTQGRAIQIGYGGLYQPYFSTTNSQVVLANNGYQAQDANYKYLLSTNKASSYQQVEGSHNWYTAAGGTAGDPITFTTAMTLDASSNLNVAGTITSASRGIAKASMPAGSVLQVVNVAYSTNVSTASTSFVTTGINASITPTSATSKILVIFSVNAVNPSGTLSNIITVFRGDTSGTNLSSAGNFGESYASSGNIQVSICGSALDSPATTSATNYQVCFKVNGGTGQINGNAGNTSTITLMEIAA